MSIVEQVEGGCFCGAVRYRAHGEWFSMVCHCRTCQRVAAAPVVAWATFRSEAFAFIHGTPRYFRSSENVRRSFCSDCGTPLTYETADSPEYVDVATASLDHPEQLPPTHHSWLSHNIGWVRFGDGLPHYPESRHDGN